MPVSAQKTDAPIAAPPARQNDESVIVSINFLTDMISRLSWRKNREKGAWEACFCALVLFLTPQCRPRKMLESLPVSDTGLDRTGFRNAMAHLGYFSNTVSIRMGDIEPRLLPCLFDADHKNTPCVLLSRTKDRIKIYDSIENKIKTVTPKHPLWRDKGAAVLFQPFDSNRPATSRFMRAGTQSNWFRALVRRFTPTFWMILSASLMLNIIALAAPLFIMAVYDRVISPVNPAALMPLAVGVGIALVAEMVLRAIRSQGLAWITARMDHLVGSKIFSHLIGLKPDLIEQTTVAAQVARIKTFESIRDFFSSAVFLSFIEIPFVMIALMAIAAIAGKIVLVPLFMIGAYLVLFAWMRQKIKSVIRLAAKASSAKQELTIETFDKLRNIRMSGLTSAWQRKFSELSGRDCLMAFHLGWLGTVAETVAHMLTLTAAVMTIGFGVHFIWDGGMTTGALVATMILVWRVLMPFYSLCTMIPRLEQLRNSVIQINNLMELETETEKSTHTGLPSVRGHIALENVTLTYAEKSDTVFSNLICDLKPGHILTVTGKNGAGKTSLLKIIKGMQSATSGTVRLDGFDIRQLDPVELRRQIAYIPQHPDFFPGTLRENLLIGNPLASEDHIKQALVTADIWDDINSMKDGLDSDIGKGRLPAGFAARLSLARAYLNDSTVLLIDELPNAVMNGRAGENLKRYLIENRGRKTVILATHRADLMDLADYILQLNHGGAYRLGRRKDIIRAIREAA